jgi:hypothetical protein
VCVCVCVCVKIEKVYLYTALCQSLIVRAQSSRFFFFFSYYLKKKKLCSWPCEQYIMYIYCNIIIEMLSFYFNDLIALCLCQLSAHSSSIQLAIINSATRTDRIGSIVLEQTCEQSESALLSRGRMKWNLDILVLLQ